MIDISLPSSWVFPLMGVVCVAHLFAMFLFTMAAIEGRLDKELEMMRK